VFLILEAAAVTGIGSMKKRQELLITTVNKIKHDMFNKAKIEMLKNFNNLKVLISYLLRRSYIYISTMTKVKLNLLLFLCKAADKGFS